MLQYLGGPVGFLESWSEVLKDGMASVPHWLIIWYEWCLYSIDAHKWLAKPKRFQTKTTETLKFGLLAFNPI